MTLAHYFAVQAAPIEHVFRFNLANAVTRATVLDIAGKSSIEDLGEWPGVTFPIEEYQAKAALSTANGIGVAYMLIQHKAQMGVRKVDRVNLWNCAEKIYDSDDSDDSDVLFDTNARLCMYFHIKAV